jgi:hypothetical protein
MDADGMKTRPVGPALRLVLGILLVAGVSPEAAVQARSETDRS